MRCMTRILLVPIFLVPILWVWPQRGTTAAFYTNPQWSNAPAIVRVERQINLDFVTADSSLPQQDFSVEWSGWLRIDRDGQYTFSRGPTMARPSRLMATSSSTTAVFIGQLELGACAAETRGAGG